MKKTQKSPKKLQLRKLTLASMNDIVGGKEAPSNAAGGATATVTNWVSLAYKGKVNCVIYV